MSAMVEPALKRQSEPAQTASMDSLLAQVMPEVTNFRGKLTILSGPQQGAADWLVTNKPQALGSSLDNDIVLRSPAVEQLHASLLLTHENIIISCLAGTVVVNDTSLAAGESMPLVNTAILQLGDILLRVECETDSSPQIPSGMLGQSTVNNNEPRSEGAVDARVHEDENAPVNGQAAFFMPSLDDLPATIDDQNDVATDQLMVEPTSKIARPHFLARKSSLLTICTMLVGTVVVWQSGLFHKVVPPPFDLQPALAESQFPALQVSQFGSVATVGGFLHTVEESRQLDQWLDQTGLNISNEVVVGETLGEQIVDIFRVYGIAAEVDVKEGGHVVVETAQPDNGVLDGVEESIKTDIPGVASLAIDNTPPPISEATAVMKMDPGKRVAMVVSDAPAYVVTEDQSRYFVGSILPTGHRIASIENGNVNLERNGVSSTLEF